MADEKVNQQIDFQDYDFNRPDKFNMQNTKSLEAISNVFARSFSQLISATLRLPIRLELAERIEQMPYSSEYIENRDKDTYVFIVTDVGNSELGKWLVEIDLNMIFPIHKKLLGGKEVEVASSRRLLTEIEIIAMKEWINELLFPQMQEAFRSVVDMHLSISQIETDPQYVKITTATDMIALITFNVFIGKSEKKTTLRICIPYLSVESIIEKFTTENVHEFKLEKENGNEEELLKSHLSQVRQKVEVDLGTTQLTLKELLEFNQGDTLVLDNKVDEPLKGYIGGLYKFNCFMGKKGNKVAVKIKAFSQQPEERVQETEEERYYYEDLDEYRR